MPSRRDQITMSDDELRAFLAAHKVVSVASIGPRGRPHLVPLWYVADGVELRGWTYAKSQKAKNLERDPRATLQVEDGELYHELRGVMMECDVSIEREPAEVAKYGVALFERFVEVGPRCAGDGREAGAEARRPDVPPHPRRELGPRQAGRCLLMD